MEWPSAAPIRRALRIKPSAFDDTADRRYAGCELAFAADPALRAQGPANRSRFPLYLGRPHTARSRPRSAVYRRPVSARPLQ